MRLFSFQKISSYLTQKLILSIDICMFQGQDPKLNSEWASVSNLSFYI